jgi:hypothetical protein
MSKEKSLLRLFKNYDLFSIFPHFYYLFYYGITLNERFRYATRNTSNVAFKEDKRNHCLF